MPRQNGEGAQATRRAGGEHPPAAAALLAPAQAVELEDRKPLTFDAVDKVDQREKEDRYLRRPTEDWLNEAVGMHKYILNASMGGWVRAKTGLTFAVTRFYWHKKVAVDFPRVMGEVTVVEEKRQVLRRLGIAYVAIMPNESLTIEQVQERIESERAIIAGAMVPVNA